MFSGIPIMTSDSKQESKYNSLCDYVCDVVSDKETICSIFGQIRRQRIRIRKDRLYQTYNIIEKVTIENLSVEKNTSATLDTLRSTINLLQQSSLTKYYDSGYKLTIEYKDPNRSTLMWGGFGIGVNLDYYIDQAQRLTSSYKSGFYH